MFKHPANHKRKTKQEEFRPEKRSKGDYENWDDEPEVQVVVLGWKKVDTRQTTIEEYIPLAPNNCIFVATWQHFMHTNVANELAYFLHLFWYKIYPMFANYTYYMARWVQK